MTILEELEPKQKKEKKAVVKRAPKTMKEKKFAKAYIETGNATLAVKEAGYMAKTYSSATSIASENLSKLDFSGYFEEAGLTDQVIAQSITFKALTAKKRDQFTGEVEDDHAEQRKNLELALKIMGKFAAPRAAVDENGKTVVPIMDLNAILGDDRDS